MSCGTGAGVTGPSEAAKRIESSGTSGQMPEREKRSKDDTMISGVNTDAEPSPKDLNILGYSHLMHFRKLGKTEDLNKAVECFSQAVALTPDGDPEMPRRIVNMGLSYTDRFRRMGQLNDLEKPPTDAKPSF
ncbi:unnamed protein product [Rhizoctonia solani]|uniref:Uncharacterized protein n=1 Tax=Rhizoctonia solani TaxID=456999 RepID=A0A8H3I160_9AGAM|nr:unnamed protein product [Rhizoctonia solani]